MNMWLFTDYPIHVLKYIMIAEILKIKKTMEIETILIQKKMLSRCFVKYLEIKCKSLKVLKKPSTLI